MDKLSKLIEQAKQIKRIEPGIDFSNATMSELLDMINESTSNERFHEIVTALVWRAGSGVPYGQ
jgi:hypothetical protein